MEKEFTSKSLTPIIEESISKRMTALRYVLAFLVVMFHNNKTLLFVVQPGALSFSNPEFWLHLPQLFFQYVFTVAPVPLFFIFSAYLTGKKNHPYKILLKKKFFSLFLPLILWPALVIGIRILAKMALILLFPDKVTHELPFVSEWSVRDWFSAFFGYYHPEYNKPDLCEPFILPLYFIRDLLIMDILSPLIKKIIKVCPIPYAILLAAIYALGMRPAIVCVNALVFYSLGLYFTLYDFDFFAFADKVKWKHIVFFALLLFYIFLRSLKPEFLLLLSCIILLKFSKIILEASERTFNFFKYLSGYSFFLYAVHDAYLLMIFTKIWFKIIPSNFISDLLEYFILAPILCFVGTFIGIALKKIAPKIFYILNGR